MDFGWVGDVQEVNPSLLHTVISNHMVPFVAPLGIDDEGQTYNVNADTIAHSIAVALNAGALLLVTDSGGVRKDAADPQSHLAQIDSHLFEQGKAEGWIKDGMLVKLKMAFEALQAGIDKVFILSPDDIYTRARGTEISSSSD